MPLAVVRERVGDDADALERRQVLEEGVARLRDEDGVSRIGEELEEEGIGLARAGGEEAVVGLDRAPVRAAVRCDMASRAERSPNGLRRAFVSARGSAKAAMISSRA